MPDFHVQCKRLANFSMHTIFRDFLNTYHAFAQGATSSIFGVQESLAIPSQNERFDGAHEASLFGVSENGWDACRKRPPLFGNTVVAAGTINVPARVR